MDLRRILGIVLLLGCFFTHAVASYFTSEEEAKFQPSVKPLEIDSFHDVEALFSRYNIAVDADTLVIFDFDETIAERIFKLSVDGELKAVRFIGGPDLGRTYRSFLINANDLLPRQSGSPFISMDDVYGFFPRAFQREKGWAKRLSYELLEGKALIPLVSELREQGACLKICSGLQLDQFKINLLERNIDELQFMPEDFYTASVSKAHTIKTIKRTEEKKRTKPFDKIIFFDNSLSTVTQFLKDASIIMPEVETAGIHYRYYESQITVDMLIEEYNLLQQYYGPAAIFNRIEFGKL
jgi:hypothetical protein